MRVPLQWLAIISASGLMVVVSVWVGAGPLNWIFAGVGTFLLLGSLLPWPSGRPFNQEGDAA